MKWDHKLTMRYSTHGWLGPRSAEVSVDSLSLAATTNYTIRHILPNIFTVHKYHGLKRETDLTKLRNFDIVFTTYATIAAEFCKGVSLIHQLEYYRLVLDEGKNMVRVGAQRFKDVALRYDDHCLNILLIIILLWTLPSSNPR